METTSTNGVHYVTQMLDTRGNMISEPQQWYGLSRNDVEKISIGMACGLRASYARPVIEVYEVGADSVQRLIRVQR